MIIKKIQNGQGSQQISEPQKKFLRPVEKKQIQTTPEPTKKVVTKKKGGCGCGKKANP